MEIRDNVLKEALRNVYFVAGTACGGKSTAARALGEKYGIPVYGIDGAFGYQRELSDPAVQPNMNRRFAGADEFFARTTEEYEKWLLGNLREQLDFVIADLIRLSRDGIVLCDCGIVPEEADRLTDPGRIVFLTRDPQNLCDEYCARPDHRDFRDFLYGASDPEGAKALVNETLGRINARLIDSLRGSRYYRIDRGEGHSPEETVRLVEEHFGWSRAEGLVIERIEKGTELADRFAEFVENCSWTETREHIAGMVRSWVFTDWEAMFCALIGGKIVGMTSVMKKDYYPLPEVFPWVSCVFVDEAYRGARISEKLIAHANRYLAGLGFQKSYIPSEYAGLYERYGYRYVKDIINYGGGTDHLFEKDLILV